MTSLNWKSDMKNGGFMTINIFEALRNDHEVQRELLAKLINTHGDSPERRKLFEKLKKEVTDHAKAEERYFYSPLIEHDQTIDKARHSVAEHHELDELIDQLDEMEFSNTAWLTVAKQLSEKLEHHLSEEEHEIFQVAGKVLSSSEKALLAQEYNTEMHHLEGDSGDLKQAH